VHLSIRTYAPPIPDDDATLKKKARSAAGAMRRGLSRSASTAPPAGGAPGAADGRGVGDAADADGAGGCCGCVVC